MCNCSHILSYLVTFLQVVLQNQNLRNQDSKGCHLLLNFAMPASVLNLFQAAATAVIAFQKN